MLFCSKGPLNLINSTTCTQPDLSLMYFLSHSLFVIIKEFVSHTMTQNSDVFKYFFKVLFLMYILFCFCFLSILEPKKLTPVGVSGFMKNTASRSPKTLAPTCPIPVTDVWKLLKRLHQALHPRDIAFFPQGYRIEGFQSTKLRRRKMCSQDTKEDNKG